MVSKAECALVNTLRFGHIDWVVISRVHMLCVGHTYGGYVRFGWTSMDMVGQWGRGGGVVLDTAGHQRTHCWTPLSHSALSLHLQSDLNNNEVLT